MKRLVPAMKRLVPAIMAISAAVAACTAAGVSMGVRPPDARARWGGPAGWLVGRAIEVPGLGALNTGGDAGVESVSCGSAGNCTAGGEYGVRRDHLRGFVAIERHGVWGRAVEVPGLGALNKGGFAVVDSVSCASAGNCAAGGEYTVARGPNQGFVVVERNGRWGTATGVPGLGALNKGGGAAVHSVSCAPAGTCAADGDYTDRRGHFQGFVVSQAG